MPAKTPKPTRRLRNSHSISTPAFDPNTDPGEELDPTVVTMATLCDDIGQGRVSSKAAQILDNHAAWKRSNKERRERMKVLMEAKKYGREEETSAGTSSNSQTDPSQSTNVGSSSSVPETTAALASTNTQAMTVGPSDGLGRGFDYSQSMTTSRF